jgi:uncharacterized protein (DUF58 family)
MTPTSLCLRLLMIVSVMALAAAWWPAALWVWGLAGGGVALVLALDLGLAFARPPTEMTRELAGTLALGVWTRALLRVHNATGVPMKVVVHENHPPVFAVEHLPRIVRVPAKGWVEVPYALRTTQRGLFELGPLVGRQVSPLGFWWRTVRMRDSHSVRVYPNFRAVARYALLATSNRTSQLGIRRRRRRGEGTEFHQLREYRVGDSLRQIDWRATSRIRKVISREYRDERDQQIVFLLDCGRRMHAQDGELNHLDHALDAVLLLAYVALRQGDAVGLMTFGGHERRLPPRKGNSYLNALLNTVFDLSTTTAVSDTSAAVEEAVKMLRRRTLIVLVTNMRDERDHDLVSMLRLASRRHLVLLASLREQIIGEALATWPSDFEGALRLAATRELVRARADAHDKLERTGLLAMDVEPREFAASLVNRYLRIKASGVL